MAHRTFKDRHGGVWDVWEVHPTMAERRVTPQDQDVVIERRKRHQPRASLPEEMRSGWLAFESRAEKRRLAPTPDGWEDMTDAQLVALFERAVVTGKTKRLIE